MNTTSRSECLDLFQKGTKFNVLTASLKATNAGLNITAASEVIFLDLWWNPTIEDQAIARVHRMGQTKQVNITRFCINDTIEEGILKIQERKVVFDN